MCCCNFLRNLHSITREVLDILLVTQDCHVVSYTTQFSHFRIMHIVVDDDCLVPRTHHLFQSPFGGESIVMNYFAPSRNGLSQVQYPNWFLLERFQYLQHFAITIKKAMSHITNFEQAMSRQISDLAPNPLIRYVGTVIVGRYLSGPPSVFNPRIAHQTAIKGKRDKDDMEMLRQILSGMIKRPANMMANAGTPMAAPVSAQ